MNQSNPFIPQKNLLSSVAIVLMKNISDTDDDFKTSLLSLKSQKFPGIIDTWVLDENLSYELKKWCKENDVKLSSRLGLNLYNRKVWPRKIGSLEGALSYFIDKYSTKYEYISIIMGAHKASPDYISRVLNKFNADSKLEILSVGSEDRKAYQIIPSKILAELKIQNFTNVTIKQSIFEKINNFAQGDLFLMNSFMNQDFETETSKEIMLTKVRSSPLSKSSFSEIFIIYYELTRYLLQFSFKNSFSKLSALLFAVFTSTTDLVRLLIIFITPFLLVLFKIHNTRTLVIFFICILILDMVVNYLQNSLSIRRYPEEDLSLLTFPVQFAAILTGIFDNFFFKGFRKVKEKHLRPIVYLFHIIYISFLIYFSYKHQTSSPVILFTASILITYFFKIILLIKKSVLYFMIVFVVFLSAFFYTSFFQDSQKVYADDSWVSRVNDERSAIGVSPIQESFLLKKAAQLKVYDMFDTNSHEHSVPQSYYLDAVGFYFTHSKEILYEGVGTLDKIFTYWDSKEEYHQAILDPQYCYGGFWTETRIVDGMSINRTAMYLVSTVTGCGSQTSSSTKSTSISTATSLSSSKTSTKTSTSTSNTTTTQISAPTNTSSSSNVTSQTNSTSAVTPQPTSSVSTSKKTTVSTPRPVSSNEATVEESTTTETSEMSTSSVSSESSSLVTTTFLSTSSSNSTSSSSMKSVILTTSSSSSAMSENSSVNWRDLLTVGLLFIVIVMGKFYYDVFYYFEK